MGPGGTGIADVFAVMDGAHIADLYAFLHGSWILPAEDSREACQYVLPLPHRPCAIVGLRRLPERGSCRAHRDRVVSSHRDGGHRPYGESAGAEKGRVVLAQASWGRNDGFFFPIHGLH